VHAVPVVDDAGLIAGATLQLLQESLVTCAQIILVLDESSTEMKNDWKIKPDVDRSIANLFALHVESLQFNLALKSRGLTQLQTMPRGCDSFA